MPVDTTESKGSATRLPAPKDCPAFIARYANAAVRAHTEALHAQACRCAQCSLSVLESQISEYVCGQVVASALTGDTSKLTAILDLIAGQKKST